MDCFALSGDIDRATVPSLRAELLAFVMRTSGDVTLNCAGLASIDRDGIRSLLALRDWLWRDGRCLHIVNLSDSLAQELDRTRSGLVGLSSP